MIGFLLAGILGGRPYTLSISGETINDIGSDPCKATVIFKRDGTLFKSTSAGNSQIDSATDWINPEAQHATVGDSFEARWTTTPTDTFTVDGMGGINNWTTINTDLEVGYSSDSLAKSSGSITFEIRRIGEPSANTSGAIILAKEPPGP